MTDVIAELWRARLPGVNGRESLRIIAVHGLIVVAVIICATVLTAIGQMPESVTESFYGAALAFGGAVSAGVIRRQVPKVQSPVAPDPRTGIRPPDGPAVATAAAPPLPPQPPEPIAPAPPAVATPAA